MSMHKRAEIIGTIESLLKEVGGSTKSAAAKKSEAYTEAGGLQGATTHPVKDVDDRCEAASEGARSAENVDDVKNEPNRGAVVDKAQEGPGAGQDSVQTNVGITSKATGEDSSSETDSAKDGKQDGNTSHPARADNDELDGHKYASALNELIKKAEKLGENLCAWIATNTEVKKSEESAAGSTNSQAGGVGVADGPITTEGKVEAKSDGGGNTAAKSTISEKVGQAGYDLAGIFANTEIPLEDKVATDKMVVDDLSFVIETALRRAEKCAQFYAAHFDPRNQKRAEGEEEGKSEGSEGSDGSEGDPSAAGGDPLAGGGGGDAGAGGGGGPSPEEEALLMQLLQGGEGMGAEGAMGEMGGGGGEGGDPLAGGGAGAGGDPMAAMGGGGAPPGGGGGDPMAAMGGAGGGDPMAAMGGGGAGAPPGGGDPMAAMGGGGGAGGAGGIDPAMLQQILAELGIDPSQLQQKISASRKQAAQKKAAAKKTKWQPKTAADREKYARMKQVITEITGRSRA
jgi:hypothetical protein